MTFGTWIYTKLFGNKVGEDAFGNRYFNSKGVRPDGRHRRWVVYKKGEEASTIPPDWHAWVHHVTDKVPTRRRKHAWEKPHMPNFTGTEHAYRPPGHFLEGSKRDAARGDYEAWSPGK